jgi:hypothetical protein
VGVFAQWYRALRLSAQGAQREEAESAYRAAAARLDGAGMPGVQRGLLPLALLSVHRRRPPAARILAGEGTDWGPYEPWVRPLALLARGRQDAAANALAQVPDPPRDLLFEAMWCLTGEAAVAVGDRQRMERARDELLPAADELAGAGSGLLTLGPVADHLAALDAALRR